MNFEINKTTKKNLNIMEIGLAKGDGIASFYYYFPNSYFIGLDNNILGDKYADAPIRVLIFKNFLRFINLVFSSTML